MIDLSKVKESLPDCELGEIRPCTTKGKVQFHLIVRRAKDPTEKILDPEKLATLFEEKGLSDVKSSVDLGVVKATYNGAEIVALASGRIVVKKAENEAQAKELLELLAPLLQQSFFTK